MKKYSSLLMAVLLLAIACKNAAEKEQGTPQMKTVMGIHDEVMPKMGHLGKLVGQLKPMADSLGMDSPQGKAMRDLQGAHKAMMDWMQDFGNTFDSEEILKGKALTPEKQALLNNEEEKIRVVKDKINSSIAQAEALLAKE